jgi:hypothetical protein
MSWGGARAGAGRPAKGPIPSERHRVRPPHAAHQPVHVTTRVARVLHALEPRRAHAAVHRALQVSLGRGDFRIVHIAITGKQLDLIVEADDRVALARGMQGFQVSAARWLNRSAHRSGTVFPDRYRMRILSTRAAVRDAIGRLPGLRATAWPHTWLLRVESSIGAPPSTWMAPPTAATASAELAPGSSGRRRSLRTRAHEHSPGDT